MHLARFKPRYQSLFITSILPLSSVALIELMQEESNPTVDKTPPTASVIIYVVTFSAAEDCLSSHTRKEKLGDDLLMVTGIHATWASTNGYCNSKYSIEVVNVRSNHFQMTHSEGWKMAQYLSTYFGNWLWPRGCSARAMYDYCSILIPIFAWQLVSNSRAICNPWKCGEMPHNEECQEFQISGAGNGYNPVTFHLPHRVGRPTIKQFVTSQFLFNCESGDAFEIYRDRDAIVDFKRCVFMNYSTPMAYGRPLMIIPDKKKPLMPPINTTRVMSMKPWPRLYPHRHTCISF